MRSDSSLWGQSDTEMQNEMDRRRCSRSWLKLPRLRGYPSPRSAEHSEDEHMHSFMASAHVRGHASRGTGIFFPPSKSTNRPRS